jgi:hypothetical protein
MSLLSKLRDAVAFMVTAILDLVLNVVLYYVLIGVFYISLGIYYLLHDHSRE